MRSLVGAVLLVAGVCGLWVRVAWSHGGGLDAYGCHHDRKRGGYHCHRGELAGQSFASKAEMLVRFRFACNSHLRYVVHTFAWLSLSHSEWARAYYRQQRARGHSHPQALRALGAKWLKIIFVMWKHQTPYDENLHLANIARQTLREAV